MQNALCHANGVGVGVLFGEASGKNLRFLSAMSAPRSQADEIKCYTIRLFVD